MGQAARLRDRSTYRGPSEASEKTLVARRRYWTRLSPDERSRRLATFIAAGQRYNRKIAKTRAELIVAGVLEALAVRYDQNVQIARYNVDLLLEDRVVVECFGDFWHCNPRQFAPEALNRSLRMTASEKWGKDAARIRWLQERGYTVHVLWEWDIRHERDNVANRLAKIVESVSEDKGSNAEEAG